MNSIHEAVDVGTNGGPPYAPPAAAPARSDAVLVTDYYYDDAGRIAQTTDPRGLNTRYSYDALGRTVETVANANAWPNPVAAPTGSTNNTTRFTYDGLDHVVTVTAVMPAGTPDQTTTYNYGVTEASGSGINSNDLLRSVVQPDATAVSYTYNALGQTISATDALGTTHQYQYDVVGRLTSDAVATLGTGVDGAVRRIETAYDTAGRAYLFTSYDASVNGAIVNQTLDQFNGFGQLAAEYQSHSGAVNTSTTPSVQYAYSTPDASHNYSRLTFMAYPNGRVVGFAYDAGIDAAVSRLSSIVDYATAATLESYKYLGLDTIVERSQPGAKTKLTYVRQPGDPLANGDGGDQYTGLDRFGRVIDQNWVRTATSATGAAAGSSTIRLQYGYDRDGNALFRHDLLFEALDDLYAYDGLNRLSSYKRGVLSRSTPSGPLDTVATPYGQQSWTLDAQGNWSGFTYNATTTNRTFNATNETTTVNGSSSSAPTYDANGNTTSKDGKSLVYDAWNRLVAVKNGATTLVSYAYDALRRRIKETKSSGTTDAYFTPAGQIAEERFGTTTYQYVQGASGQTIFRDVYASGALQSSWRLYVQQDANNNVVALVGGSPGTAGDRQEWYWYTPSGSVQIMAGDGSGRTGSYHDWRSFFQSGRLDSSTGLYVFGLRDYDPASGVWQQRDPIGLRARDPNLYRFTGNNPINRTDPSGLEPITITTIVVTGALMGLAAYTSYNAAVVVDDYWADRPIDSTNTPYSLDYYVGAAESTAVGAGVGYAGPIVAGAYPTAAAGSALFLSVGGLFFSANSAIDDFSNGNYAQGTFHSTMGVLSGYGTYMSGRTLFPNVFPTQVPGIARPSNPAAAECPRPQGIQANKAAGDAVRDAIAAREAPSLVEQTFVTVGGVRRVDVLKLGDELISIESKVGRTSLGTRERQEVARDWWLRRQGQVNRVCWEFTRSETTGKVGPTEQLADILERLGFDIRINP